MSRGKILFKLVKGSKLITILQILALIFYIAYPLFSPTKANATITEGFVRFNRLSTGAAISGTACLKTSTSGTETNVVITFPTGWTVSGTASNWTVSTTNLPVDPADGTTGATAWPGIGTASSVNGLNVVFPGSDLSTGTFYCFNFAGASSTIGSAGNDQAGSLKTQGGAPYVDNMTWATSIVTSNADQISVTASVSATMTFALSGNSIALGTLSTSTVTSGNVTQTVSTNARNGWVSWIQGTSTTGGTGGGLHSATANADIPSPSSFPNITDLASNTGVVIDVDTGTGSPTVAAGYNGGNATSGGHFDGALYHMTASNTVPASGNTVTINVRAKVAATQAAASDYADTLVAVAAGQF